MFSKKNLLASLAGFSVIFLFGYVVWGLVLEEFFIRHTLIPPAKPFPNLFFVVLGNLFGAFAMASVYRRWAHGAYQLREGFRFGCWIGAFVGLGIGLLNYGVMEVMDLTGHLVDAFIEIFFYGIIGTVIAWVYKSLSKPSVV